MIGSGFLRSHVPLHHREHACRLKAHLWTKHGCEQAIAKGRKTAEMHVPLFLHTPTSYAAYWTSCGYKTDSWTCTSWWSGTHTPIGSSVGAHLDAHPVLSQAQLSTTEENVEMDAAARLSTSPESPRAFTYDESEHRARVLSQRRGAWW